MKRRKPFILLKSNGKQLEALFTKGMCNLQGDKQRTNTCKNGKRLLRYISITRANAAKLILSWDSTRFTHNMLSSYEPKILCWPGLTLKDQKIWAL